MPTNDSKEEEEESAENAKLDQQNDLDKVNNNNDNDNIDNNNDNNNDNNDNNDNNNDDNNDEIKQPKSNPPDNSFEYVTSAHGESSKYDFLLFVTDGKIDGDCPKDLRKILIKIYKHVYRSILDLYDLPITRLSLHFGVNDKGEIEEEEEEKNDDDNGNQNVDDTPKENPENNTNEDSNEQENDVNKEQKVDNDKQTKDDEGKLENQIESSVNGLLGPQKTENDDKKQNEEEDNKEQKDQDENDNNQTNDGEGKLEDNIENNVNGLLNSPKEAEPKKEEPSHLYEIFLLEDSSCTTSTQTVGPEGDDDDLDGKFGEFFSEEIKTKISYDRCYFDRPDCGVSNYKAPRSMCILLKAHQKFPKASCARLQDLTQVRFERFDEEKNPNDESDRNSYSTDLNAGSNYTTDSSAFNNREYNNFTKTIIDYDLYNENNTTKRPKSSQSKKSKNDQKSSQKVDSEDPDKDEQQQQKTTELNDPKVFVCVRCWHLISSINYVAFMQHQQIPTLHTLPPLPFQPVVQSELYEKRLYPMGLTAGSNKPFSFILSYENSPYRLKVPHPRKPPPVFPNETVKRPKTVSSLSSSNSRKKQDVFQRLLNKTWSTQRNESINGKQYEISKGYKRPKTKPVKMIVFQENPAALNSVKRNYANPPFNINMIDPKRKKKLHPAFGGPEDFSFRMGGPNEVSGKRLGDDRPDFVI